MSFMGLKCWTKGEHQISKLQLQLECVCVLHSVWNSISLMEAEHANCHHSLLTLPSANLAATSKVAHSCMHHIYLCNNIVLREYSNMLKQYNMLQQYKHCYNMLQHQQVCSIVALQNCSNAKTSITWCTLRPVCLGGTKHCGQSKCMLWRIEEWWDQYVVQLQFLHLHTWSRYVCLKEMATLPNPDVVRLFCLLQDCCAISRLWIFILNSKAICFSSLVLELCSRSRA